MDGKYKTALCRITGIHHLLDLIQALLRIELTPLCTLMIWIILRCEDIGRHLKFSAKLHQRDAVFIRPWNSIISLDEATGLCIRVILYLQAADRRTIHLRKDVFQ